MIAEQMEEAEDMITSVDALNAANEEIQLC